MSLETIIKAAQFKISGGSPMLWKCYGDNARYLDFSTNTVEDVASVIFDSVNQTVYEISFHPGEDKYYRWINPEFFEAYMQEAISRDFDHDIVMDDIPWIDCDLEIDITEKINSFFLTGSYDERIMISLDLSDEAIQALVNLAGEKGVSIDDVVNDILIDIIDKKTRGE